MKKLFSIVAAILLLASPCFAESETTIGGATATSHLIQDEGTTVRSRPYLNFTGAGVTATDDSGKTIITIGGGASTPGGADTQVQFNDGGAFNGESTFTYNKALNSLSIDRIVIGPGIADYLMPTARGAANTYLRDNGAGAITFSVLSGIGPANFTPSTDFGDVNTDAAGAIRFGANSMDDTHINWGSMTYLGEEGISLVEAYAAVGTFESGDTFICYEAGVGARECDYDDLPAGGGSGDVVTVNSGAVDTTANFKDTATISWALVDGGAGGPDDVQASRIAKQQTLEVCKSGCAYSVIQTAIDAIGDNATDKRYSVLIYPGTYTENITMEDFVSLQGVGKKSNVIIAGTITFAADAGDNSAIKGLLVQLTTTTTGLDLITSPDSTGQHAIINSTISLTNTDAGDVGSLIDDDGGTLKIRNSKLVYNFDGSNAGANTHAVIDLAGTLTYDIYESIISIDVADVDDTVIGLNEVVGGIITEGIIKNTNWDMNLSHGTYTGLCGLFYLHGTSVEKYLQSNHFHLTSDGGGTAYGMYMDTTAGGGIIHSTANKIAVTGFTTNYGSNIAPGDTILSHFDDVDADGGNTGTGTVTTVQSPSDGNLTVTGYATVGTSMTADTVVATTSLTGTYLTASEIVITDASKNVVSAPVATYPSLTELSYVKDVTSAIQTQINAKAPSASPTITTKMTLDYATASELVSTNASKELVSLAVATYPSLTELSYVKGLASAAQTQITARGSHAGQVWTGTHDFGGAVVEISNGAAVTDPASIGQIAIDSTSDQFLYYGTAQRVLTSKYEESITVEDIAAADDGIPFGSKSYARTVTNVGCRCIGTCTTKAEFSFSDSAANAFTLAATPTCATTGAATYQAVNSGGALIAGEGMLFNVTNSVSPETDWYEIMWVETVTAD